ncbi:MAG: GDP-mannose 4,6-dehydratase [Candidatus Thorarchaeota archaeon]
MSKRVLITGITGQDGSYLAEYLLSQGHEVHGLIRKASTFNTKRIDHLYQDPHEQEARLFLHYSDITDTASTTNLLREIEPSEVYHLAAQSHVKVSFELPIYTGDVTGLGATTILEAIRKSKIETRFYNAASSEMFGASPPPQNESTPFHPRSPYAAAKVYSYWITINYRESYGMHASNGILFNHESPRRGETFVTRKISRAVADIMAGTMDTLYLGNLKAKRDWGYAPEYVMGMVKILRLKKPDDVVLGTGVSYSVEEFLSFCFDYVGMDWKKYVKIDPRYLRPSEVDHLTSDPSKAKELLGWNPKILAPVLAKVMLDHDMTALGLSPPNQSREILESSGIDWVVEPEISSSKIGAKL